MGRRVSEKRDARPPCRATRPLAALLAAIVSCAVALAGCTWEGPRKDAGSDAVAPGGATALAIVEDTRDAQGNRELQGARSELEGAVADIEAQGAALSYILIDLDTGASLEHRADATYYSASTIKAPFCISLVRAQGASARSAYGERIEACLVDSDNDAYRGLRADLYGQRFFADFCQEAEVPFDLEYWYADYSVRHLAALWRAARPWLDSDGPEAVWMRGLLADTLESRVDDLAPRGARTCSKAGWYSGGGPDYDVTFDGGVIETETGSCVIAVATDRGSDFRIIERVMRPLIAAWEAGGAEKPAE